MGESLTSPIDIPQNESCDNNKTCHQRTLSRKYESLDYDLIENVLHLEYQHKSRLNKFITRDLQRWLAIFLIGVSAAMSGFVASFSVNYLTRLKFLHIIHYAEQYCPNKHKNWFNSNSTIDDDLRQSTNPPTYLELFNCMLIPYLFWLIWNIIPSLLGTLLVTYISPIAAGSGIPVVKCYLNGVKIPDVVHLKTYLVKLLGVICSVVGGLAVGKEGPFIHCGAALGAGISQGKSTLFNFDLKLFKSFRNDRDKRDFVSAGASAGVAAAFGAPIGGVLFALEEGASFWNQALTWRIFFCSMMTSFILNLIMSAYNNNAGVLAFYSLVNFGLVEELDYFWFEIPVYICIAILGGIIGASVCHTHVVITNFRMRFVDKKWKKIIETVLVAILTATIGATLIILASDCRPIPKTRVTGLNYQKTLYDLSNNILYSPSRLWKKTYQNLTYDGDSVETKAIDGHVMSFMCPPGQYSAMSSLWLKTSEGAASTFMVLQEDIWSIKTLSLFMVAYYLLTVITYGLSISSGVFIPSLLLGATGGRLVGLILRHFFGPLVWLDQLNKFSIIGASSVLGGVVRMTISLTVIMIEATGCISFGLPIMICLMVSKWVADSFIEGLYDLAIHFANVPFLDWEPPIRSYSIYASDVMSHNVKVLRTTETVASLVNTLKSTAHNGFPVVDFDDDLNESRNFPSSTPFSGDYYTPEESPAHSRIKNLFSPSQPPTGSTSSDTHQLVTESDRTNEDSLIGSFQRCSITAKRTAYGRFRGLVLRWQLLVMLHLRIFNENERSFEMLSLPAFNKSYPRHPTLEQVIAGLTPEMYQYHVDLRAIMSPTPYNVLYSASFPRIYRLFRSLGLRHLVVIDDRNQVVGMITRKDLARYVRRRDENGLFRFYELKYSS